MIDITDKLRVGAHLFDEVMKVDAAKLGLQAAEVESRLDSLFLEFCKKTEIGIDIKVRFGDVHAMMGRAWHTELAFVVLDGATCTFNFHSKLLRTDDYYAALIFVAKSWVLLLVLEQIIPPGPARPVGFVFEIGDNGGLDSVSFCSSNAKACLIVDFDFATSNGYERFRRESRRERYEWSQRIDRLFWRGATTGRRLRDAPAKGAPDDLQWLHRLQLCLAARDPKIASFCDFGISDVVQIPEAHLRENISAANLLKPKVPRGEFSRYKFVVDIDGNSNAWSGLFCSLLGGSCVFKVASPQGFREWYYDELAPWREYVPVRSDFSDLPAALEWVRNNDSLAREIAERGRRLAERTTMQAALDASAKSLKLWLERRPALGP